MPLYLKVRCLSCKKIFTTIVDGLPDGKVKCIYCDSYDTQYLRRIKEKNGQYHFEWI